MFTEPLRLPRAALAAALLLPALACTQPDPPAATARPEAPKELVIIRDYDDCWRLAFSLMHVVELKRAGAEVRVIFQDEAVLAALYYPFPVQKFDGENIYGDRRREHKDPRHDYRSGTTDTRPAGNPRATDARICFSGELMTPSEKSAAVYREFKALKIPYTVSALHAKALGVYDRLRAKGEPLSPDTDRAVDISGLVKEGYRVSVF